MLVPIIDKWCDIATSRAIYYFSKPASEVAFNYSNGLLVFKALMTNFLDTDVTEAQFLITLSTLSTSYTAQMCLNMESAFELHGFIAQSAWTGGTNTNRLNTRDLAYSYINSLYNSGYFSAPSSGSGLTVSELQSVFDRYFWDSETDTPFQPFSDVPIVEVFRSSQDW